MSTLEWNHYRPGKQGPFRPSRRLPSGDSVAFSSTLDRKIAMKAPTTAPRAPVVDIQNAPLPRRGQSQSEPRSLPPGQQQSTVMNWNAFDLNLLVVFDAIIQEKTLTRAGHRLGMSQPAVSHALARLRHMLKDDLFVRTPDGMSPTPRAERMAGPARAALHELQVTLEADEFDAPQASRDFIVAVNNCAARAVIPALVRRMAKLAPSVVLDVRPLGRRNVLDQLDGGEIELALTTLIDGGDRFKCVGLLDDEYAVIVSSDHPMAADLEFSIEAFAALPHIDVTSSGDDTHFVEDVLAKHFLTRTVVAKLPLHSLVSVLVGSRALAVVPRRVAADLVALCPLAMLPLPFPSPRVSLSMIWHRRLDNHPAHRWLRGTLRDAVTGV
jgi:DNA-binding transcriptional LysR family regulator